MRLSKSQDLELEMLEVSDPTPQESNKGAESPKNPKRLDEWVP